MIGPGKGTTRRFDGGEGHPIEPLGPGIHRVGAAAFLVPTGIRHPRVEASVLLPDEEHGLEIGLPPGAPAVLSVTMGRLAE